MATYRGNAWLGSASGRQTVEVNANTSHGARQQISRIYGCDENEIYNLHQVSNRSSGISVGDGSSGLLLVGIILGAWVFATLTPWILMGLGGAVGTWVGQRITGQSIEEYAKQGESGNHKKAAIILALAILAGGFGFVKGDEIKRGFDAPDTPAQVKDSGN